MSLPLTPKTLVLATGNPGKLAEFSVLLQSLEFHMSHAGGLGIALPTEMTAEQGGTLEGNALLKAEFLRDSTHQWALADDSGLFVTALPQALGVDTATYGGPATLIHALAALGPQTPRSAVFRCVLALARPGLPTLLVEASEEGSIALVQKGVGGFGYDSVFVASGQPLTNSERIEAGEPIAHIKTHRSQAVTALIDALSAEQNRT